MNYARLSEAESDHGRKSLLSLLNQIVQADPRAVFLADIEVRQFYREGLSQFRVASHEIRLRNYTREARQISVPIPDRMEHGD